MPKLKSKPKADPKVAVTIKMTAKERDNLNQHCWRMRVRCTSIVFAARNSWSCRFPKEHHTCGTKVSRSTVLSG